MSQVSLPRSFLLTLRPHEGHEKWLIEPKQLQVHQPTTHPPHPPVAAAAPVVAVAVAAAAVAAAAVCFSSLLLPTAVWRIYRYI